MCWAAHKGRWGRRRARLRRSAPRKRRIQNSCPAIEAVCGGRFPSVLPLLEAKAFHRDRRRWTSNRAQTAADTDLLVVEEYAGTAGSGLSPFENGPVVQIRVEHEMQTMLRANIDASIAQDAFAAVVNRMDVTVEASMGLGLRLVSGVAQFYLRDTAAALQRHCRDVARNLLVSIRRRVTVGRQLLDLDVHLRRT